MSNTIGQYGTPIQTQKEQAPMENKKEDESCILEQLDLGE